MSSAGRVALITGAATGLERAIAQRLARAGCDVAVADIDSAAAERTAKDMRSSGARAAAIPCDVASSIVSRGTVRAGRAVAPRGPPGLLALHERSRARLGLVAWLLAGAPRQVAVLDDIKVLARRVVLELQGRPRGLGRRLVGSLALLALDTTRRRGPLAAELLLQEPRVRDGGSHGYLGRVPQRRENADLLVALRAEPRSGRRRRSLDPPRALKEVPDLRRKPSTKKRTIRPLSIAITALTLVPGCPTLPSP